MAPFFANRCFPGSKSVNRRFEAIRANRSNVPKIANRFARITPIRVANRREDGPNFASTALQIRRFMFKDLSPLSFSIPCPSIFILLVNPFPRNQPFYHQRIAKGAGGKGPRQKTSKIVKKCQKVFRQFSRRAKNIKNRQKASKRFSTLFDNFRGFFTGPFWGALTSLGRKLLHTVSLVSRNYSR